MPKSKSRVLRSGMSSDVVGTRFTPFDFARLEVMRKRQFPVPTMSAWVRQLALLGLDIVERKGGRHG